MTLKALFLFTGYRSEYMQKVRRGDDPGDGTWGMVRLPRHGIQADFLELEQIMPKRVARWCRHRLFGVYGAHLLFLPLFFRYDIVFTAGAFLSQLVMTALRSIFRFKRPLWVMHDFSIMSLIGDGSTLRQRVFRYLVAHADGIVTVGKREADRLIELFPHLAGRVKYIPFGVDTAFFSPRGRGPEEGRILSVGVDPDRDWETLFEACDSLDITLVAATRPRGAKRVDPPSFVTMRLFPLNELVDEYEKAAIAVIPLDTSAGVNDAMGCTALFEAMAMGKAIVATRTHTMESYITDGKNGLLVPPHDPVSMRAAIERLLSDDDLREGLGIAARTYAVSHLEAEMLAGELASFFSGLASRT